MTKATKKLVFAFFVALLVSGTHRVMASENFEAISLPRTYDGHSFTHFIKSIQSGGVRIVELMQDNTYTPPSSSGGWSPISSVGWVGTHNGSPSTYNVYGNYGGAGEGSYTRKFSCGSSNFANCDLAETNGEQYEPLACAGGSTFIESDLDIHDYFGSCSYSPTYNGPADITSFVLSTTTKTLHITGHFSIASSSDPANSQALFVTRSDNVNTLLPLDFGAGNPIFATTTGAFDYWFTNIDLTLVSGPDFGQYSFYGTTTFRADLQQWTSSIASVLTSTSTSLATVTTQSVVGNGVGLDQTYGTTTLPDTGNLLSFLNVPQLLSTKVPFGYFFEAKEGIQSALSGSSTQSIPSGRITYNLGLGTTSVDMFSTTTIGVFVPPSTASLLRQLMVAALVAEVAYVLYLRGKSHHLI